MKPNNRQLFVDLDGVLADFNLHYFNLFGIKVERTPRSRPQDAGHEKPFWDRVRTKKNFYKDMPLMPDAMELWNGCCQMHPRPIILTGLPYSIPKVREQKENWVWAHFGNEAERSMICTTSKNKWLFCKTGDVLIDDWDKYKPDWENAGGVFILHLTAASSLEAAQHYFPR